MRSTGATTLLATMPAMPPVVFVCCDVCERDLSIYKAFVASHILDFVFVVGMVRVCARVCICVYTAFLFPFIFPLIYVSTHTHTCYNGLDCQKGRHKMRGHGNTHRLLLHVLDGYLHGGARVSAGHLG